MKCENSKCAREIREGKKFCDNKCQATARFELAIEQAVCYDSLPRTPRAIKRIIETLNGRKCSICNISEWLNRPAPLVLDHIDGNP